MTSDWLWIWLTLGAVVCQTARNTFHRMVAGRLAIVPATMVRFLFAFPFVAVFFALALVRNGTAPPLPGLGFFAYVVFGAFTQGIGTGLMLLAMRERSFAVTIALTKTEPVQVAVLSLLLLGDRIGPGIAVAVCVATAGVVVLSLPAAGTRFERAMLRPALLGLAAGGTFGLAAVLYRGAILQLGHAPFEVAASATLFVALWLQAIGAVLWLAFAAPGDLIAMFRSWRLAVPIGFLGAIGSQLWFAAFALQSATLVSTLGLIEVLFASAASTRFFRETPSRRELAGMAMLMAGVIVVLNI